jgi:hypothetical protein
MCGIAGIPHADPGRPIDAADLWAMAEMEAEMDEMETSTISCESREPGMTPKAA